MGFQHCSNQSRLHSTSRWLCNGLSQFPAVDPSFSTEEKKRRSDVGLAGEETVVALVLDSV